MSVLQTAFYIGILTFLVLVISKIVKIARTPAHLRWELYPVPHEKGKSKYGGSYLEEPNWWEKPREKDLFSEIISMFEEIIFLKGVWAHNRSLWWGSFPFHYALYLYILSSLLVILSFILGIDSESLISEYSFLEGLLSFLFWWSSFFGVVGSIVLLFKRIFDKDLSTFSNPSHYFNIILIGSLYVTLFFGFLFGEFDVSKILTFYHSTFTFSNLRLDSIWGQIHFYILSFFLFYLPFTHMTHFFAKYFTYHKVRWDDEPLFPGTKLYDKLQKQLNYPVKWAAPHIGADGTKTWLILGTVNPFKEKEDG
ncbi:MAG: hypothetical protein ACUVQ1_01470 [Candidatus Kapaibacteriales bacterium]